MSEKHYRQLKLKQRELIEEGLNVKKSISAIAREIGVSPSTVTREIMRNRRDDGYRKTGNSWGNGNTCINRRHCTKTALCKHCTSPKAKDCSSCAKGKCMGICTEFKEELCGAVANSPHVCNGCGNGGCRLHRYRYSARDAQASADTRSREAREGIDITPEELERGVAIIRAGIEKGQGIDHIFNAHKDDCRLPRALSTDM